MAILASFFTSQILLAQTNEITGLNDNERITIVLKKIDRGLVPHNTTPWYYIGSTKQPIKVQLVVKLDAFVVLSRVLSKPREVIIKKFKPFYISGRSIKLNNHYHLSAKEIHEALEDVYETTDYNLDFDLRVIRERESLINDIFVKDYDYSISTFLIGKNIKNNFFEKLNYVNYKHHFSNSFFEKKHKPIIEYSLFKSTSK